jgi:hypothetical protein
VDWDEINCSFLITGLSVMMLVTKQLLDMTVVTAKIEGDPCRAVQSCSLTAVWELKANATKYYSTGYIGSV